MKDLIKYIAQALVDHPEQVEVSEVEGDRILVIELKVAKEDMGLNDCGTCVKSVTDLQIISCKHSPA